MESGGGRGAGRPEARTRPELTPQRSEPVPSAGRWWTQPSRLHDPAWGLTALTRSRSGRSPHRAAVSIRSAVQRPGVGPRRPLVDGRAALGAGHAAAGVVADAVDRADRRRWSGERAGTAASSARLASIGFASGPGSCTSVGTTHSTAELRQRPARARAGAGSGRAARRRVAPGRAARARRRPSRPGGKRGGRARPGRSSSGHVVPEDPSVVHDPRQDAHAVPLTGGQRKPAGPRLERIQDQHPPVDPVAEPLQARRRCRA